MSLSPSSVVVVARDVMSSAVGSEQVMLNLGDGLYYGLDEVGADVWRMLQSPISVEAICLDIVNRYDVPMDVCRRDVSALLVDLKSRGLIEIVDE